MKMTLRTATCVTALTLAAATSAVAAAESSCDKNHYILNFPIECEWVPTGNLNAARAGHTATLLPNGMVLVAGGMTGFHESAGLYDPQTGAWLGAAPSADSAELYDPQTGTWSLAGPLGRHRSGHTATLLADGRVLVVGGEFSGHRATAEIFDPATGNWTPTGSMIAPRFPDTATATLLPSGKVLVSGGWAADDFAFGAELYDPQSDQWTATGNLKVGRYSHTTAGLGNGSVLIASGVSDEFFGTLTSAAELYDPTTGAWTWTGSVRSPRAGHASTLLMDGRVLVSGGYSSMAPPPPGGYFTFGTLASSETYDPGTGRWTPAGDLRVKRFRHTATLLPDGAVLTVGGTVSLGSVPHLTYRTLDSAELRPDDVQPSVSTSSLNEARSFHTATLLRDGSVLVVGGTADDMKTRLNSAELYGARSTGAAP